MNNITTHQNISVLFKTTRKFYGLMQSEYASILGVTQGTVSKIEAGSMSPDLGVWFKLLKSFKILDPYCFSYSGLEFSNEVFESIKQNGSKLAGKFDFSQNSYISNVRQIRPLFDYLQTKNSKVLEAFLKEQSVSIELFFILNHPLPADFVDTFFTYLDDNKINAKSFIHMDLDFNQSLGRNIDELKSSKSNESFYANLNTNSLDSFNYEISNNKNEYLVHLNKKDSAKYKNLEKSDFILDYNLLYPYHVIKSLNIANTTLPIIHEIKENQTWRIVYAS